MSVTWLTDPEQSERLDLYRTYTHKLLEVRLNINECPTSGKHLFSQAMPIDVSALRISLHLRGSGSHAPGPTRHTTRHVCISQKKKLRGVYVLGRDLL